MNNPGTIDYDIVIVGGGLVGSSLACALADTSLSVLVVEAGSAQAEVSKEYDLRVSAITGASRNLFKFINAWEPMQSMRLGEVREMHIWDASGSGSLHLDSANTSDACLAYIIENSVIRRALYDQLKTLSNITYQDNSDIKLLEISDDSVRIEVNKKIIRSRLVVGADGANSVVRDWAQIQSNGWSFNQTAIVATVETSEPHHYTAYQRFLPTGPLAFLPLDGLHTSSIVWSVDTKLANQLISLSDDDFVRELEVAIENKLGEVTNISRRASFPLSLMHVDNTAQHRMVLVGDAAHRVHPLAGQGLNLGLADVATLAELLTKESSDVGTFRILRQYERSRAGDTKLMVQLMDVFKRVYGSGHPAAQGLRNFGMDMINSNNGIKSLIMSFASGLQSDAPASLRAGKN